MYSTRSVNLVQRCFQLKHKTNIAQQKNRRIACRCNSKKEKHCSSIEQSADGSVLFRFSDEPPAKEVTATATPTPTPAATPATPVESESMSEDNKLVQQAVIIGAGRVGSALAQMGNGNDLVLKRGDTFPADAPQGPIIVCTRNDVLEQVVHSIPVGRWSDLVFLQNGVIQPWLSDMGLQNCTQMLAYFAVAKMGEAPIDGKTELNPEGLTSITGKWGEAVASRLHSAGLSCQVLGKQEFDVCMYEKLIWISAFMVVGASHGGCTVGEVCEKHRQEVSGIIAELQKAVSSNFGVVFPDGLEDRLCAYAVSVAHFPTALKEFEWRNGFFYELSRKAISSGLDDPSPMHTKLILKEVGLVSA